MSIIEGLAGVHARRDATAPAPSLRQPVCEIANLLTVPEQAWSDLADRAAEPNAFFLPAWACAVSRHAEVKSGARALLVWDGAARSRLIGLLPVVSAWRAMRVPLPVLVAWQAYAPLTTPLIDRDMIEEGARGLVAAADEAGAVALVLPSLASDGPVATALHGAVAAFNTEPRALNRHERACLDATQDAETALRELGAKKLKELRRQRNRLGDLGEVSFKCATQPADAASALESFLALESSGWKGASGTALGKKPGDTAFIHAAIAELAAAGRAEVVTLSRGEDVVAAGLILRHLRRGYFYKIAYDEAVAATSPGVQLTLDISRKLCTDGAIDDADSTAVADHPMIDRVWRSRLSVCDLVLPVRRAALPFHMIVNLLAARHAAREIARRKFRLARSSKGKQP
jgi:CelD/BcsL family acetyltransferase involved in cellulose biosynthesis